MRAPLKTRFAVLAALLVLALVPARGQQQPSLFTPAGTLPVLESYLEALRQQTGIPGMSAAVVRDGAVIWEKGYGFQNVASRVRATPDTPYVVGDISGTLSAVLLLQCVEQRRLTLDDPLRRLAIPGVDGDATLRQLLSHTPPSDAAGAALFAYNPARYAQLTAVMEWCAPQPYRKSVAHRVLNRLAMKDSVPGTDLQNPLLELPEGLFDPRDIADYRRVLQRLAVPYKVDGKGRAERNDLPGTPIEAGTGLVSTVRDLARFDISLSELLTEETWAAAWTPAEHAGVASPMGLGWFVQQYNGERLVWHFGYVQNGYSSLILKVPARNLTFILLANGDGLSAPFQLQSGDVTRSLFATLFLRLAL
ncbi:MAG: serine hydrolase domain-containing protein [Vicinamibacterales bacterium]